MSNRQDEKQRRREERIAQEQAEQARRDRTRRLQLVGGAVLALVAIVAVVVALTSGDSGGGDSVKQNAKVAIPAPGPQASNLTQAAKDAGCKVLNPPSEGRTHTDKLVTYKTNPPSSGPHNPVPAEDGIYAPGNEPTKEHWVHTLEHGRVLIQYKPGTSAEIRDQLETVGSEPFNGTDGYHVAVMENNTRMPYGVAAIAWTHVLGCPAMNAKVFDAIRAFRKQYTDKGPELIP